jgi:heme exporter protein D
MMAALFDMGKYAAYVWPAYGVSAVGLLAAVVLTLSAYGRAKRKLAALEEQK